MILKCLAEKSKSLFLCAPHKEKITKLLDQNNTYVLFSGTGINSNGPFRHLNDLFLILYLLIKNQIPSNKIYLSIDSKILENLDSRTNQKLFQHLDNGTLTYRQIFEKYIDKNNIIDATNFQEQFKRDINSDLIFIASGHGSIDGLAIDGTSPGENKFLSSDYFENISNKKNRTVLIMSQCQAAAFHHLDTRKNICVMGASDYQSSVSLELGSMFPNEAVVNDFSFEKSTAINPFIFSLFLAITFRDSLISNEKRHLINLFKYVAASTLDYLSKSGKRKIIIRKQDLIELEGDSLEFLFDERVLIQQPFLLNKILATRIYI